MNTSKLNLRRLIAAFGAGVIFAIGLGLSGMTRPEKVIGFLDVTGDWDPALAFVMGGAVIVFSILYRLVVKRQRPIFDEKFRLPTRTDLDKRLVIGGTLFGMGWGLAGFCPGPALASIPSGATEVFVFVGAMLGGMVLFKGFDALQKAGESNKNADAPSGVTAANGATK